MNHQILASAYDQATFRPWKILDTRFSPGDAPMFRFTIRDLVLLTAIAGLTTAWWLDHRQLAVAQDRLHTIIAELASRNLTVEMDADGIWIGNP